MVGMRKKRLVTIKMPGVVTYDPDGFPISISGIEYKVYCTVTKVKPDELVTYNLDRLTEVMRLKCLWNRVKNLDPKGVKLLIDGTDYELYGPFSNVDMLNIDAEFEAKRVF